MLPVVLLELVTKTLRAEPAGVGAETRLLPPHPTTQVAHSANVTDLNSFTIWPTSVAAWGASTVAD
jgi:hypothetical protein